jgi:hypothetical protein
MEERVQDAQVDIDDAVAVVVAECDCEVVAAELSGIRRGEIYRAGDDAVAPQPPPAATVPVELAPILPDIRNLLVSPKD